MIANVTAAGFPERAECDIFKVILYVFPPIHVVVVVGGQFVIRRETTLLRIT